MPLASVRSLSCHPPPATPSVCPLLSLPSSKSGYAPQAHPLPFSSGRPCQRILPPARRQARCHSEGTHARGTAHTYPAPGEGAADEARTWDPIKALMDEYGLSKATGLRADVQRLHAAVVELH